MRLLIVGATESWSIETHYLKYLCQMEGLTTEVVSSSEIAKPYQALIYKVINRLSPNYNPYHQAVNESLLQRTQLFRPDAILVFKGMEIYPQTLLQLKSLGVKLVNYNPDHPFLFVSRGSGNKNVRDNVGNYDLHLCYSMQIKQQIEKEYGLKAIHLPFGFELPEEVFKRVEGEEELLKICFIGNPDATRVQYLQYLLKNDLPVDVYGHNWEKHIRKKKNSLLTIYPAVYGLEFWRAARKYRVQLNVFRKHNEESHNMRTFEIPAIGGIMLAPTSKEHSYFFNEDKEVYLYQNFDELVKKAKYLLQLPVVEANEIRILARLKSLSNNYSYENRAYELYTSIKKSL